MRNILFSLVLILGSVFQLLNPSLIYAQTEVVDHAGMDMADLPGMVNGETDKGLNTPGDKFATSTVGLSATNTMHHHTTVHIAPSAINSPSLFKYVAPIQLGLIGPGSRSGSGYGSGSISTTTIVQLKIPTDVFAKVNAGDIKIICSDGSEVPFLMLDGEFVSPFHSLSGSLKNTFTNDGTMETIVNIGNMRMQHTDMYLEIPNSNQEVGKNIINILTSMDDNFVRSVSAYGSNEPLSRSSPKWKENTLLENGLIYNYIDSGNGQEVYKNKITYLPNKFQYIKLITKSVGGASTMSDFSATNRPSTPSAPIRITGALAQAVPLRYEKRGVDVVQLKPAKVEMKHDDIAKHTEIKIDLGQPGIYSHGFLLKAVDASIPQFIRKYTVSISRDNKNWKDISGGTIYNIKNDQFTDTNLDIEYDEVDNQYLRIIIDDERKDFSGYSALSDSLQFSKDIQIKSNTRSLVFAIEPGMTYDLYVGNSILPKTFYDRKLLRSYGTATTTEITLGMLKKNPLFDGRDMNADDWQKRGRLYDSVLWVLLIMGVMAVVGYVVRMPRRRV